MSRVSTYLNFSRNTEEVFNFYKSVFGGELEGNIMRMGDMPPQEGQPPIAEEDKNLIMNVSLPIIGNHILRGGDTPKSMGLKLVQGNNYHITLEPDTLVETTLLFNTLSEGGKITMPLQKMFWGDYFGSCTDKFDVQWMFNCSEKI